MQATRTKILAYLNSHPRSSAVEIGRFLQMTPANIRHHLGILEGGGLVQISDQRPAGGSGRPILLYNLTSQNLGDNLQNLMGAILETLEGLDDSKLVLDKIIKVLLKNFQPESGNPISILNQAVEFLNEHHYRASWKATPEGPQIELRHCPYCEIAKTQSHLCQIDQSLVSRIFNTELVLTQKREFGKNPYSACVFKPPLPDKEKGFNQ